MGSGRTTSLKPPRIALYHNLEIFWSKVIIEVRALIEKVDIFEYFEIFEQILSPTLSEQKKTKQFIKEKGDSYQVILNCN